jgi:magnesium transporter
MFRVLELDGSGVVAVSEGFSGIGPPPPGVLRWIDLESQDPAQLELLRQNFDFHPLAIEDCLHVDQRPKVEEYGEYLFLVTHGYQCRGALAEMELHELHVFLGANYIVTVHQGGIDALANVWQRAAGDLALVKRGVDFLYYLVADAMVDANFPILDLIADEIEAVETHVINRPRQADLERIFGLKHRLVGMRKVLSPQRDAFAALAKRGDARVSERTALHLRDVYDHLVRINESIESNRDILGNALDAYLSAAAQRTSEIMKALGIMSAIFLPLTFVTGFFGQNFEHLPFNSDLFMWSMIASLVLLPTGMLAWFRSREWF